MEGKITIKKLPKSEVEILITIPWEEIKKTYEEELEKAALGIQIKGFRKGKAPMKLVEEKIDRSKIYSEVISKTIPLYYQESLNKNNLKPITSPKITLSSAEEGKDWEVKILIAEKPEVNLGNYKDELRKINKSSKIWIPGEDKKEEPNQKNKEERIQKILKWLLGNIKIEISNLIIEEEVNRKLAELIDQTQKLGLTVEQYLSSTNKTPESLKEEYRLQAEELWKLEFILGEVADKENLVIENKEIEELIQKTKDEEQRKNLESQRYLLASLLRRQKTLDFLINL